MSESTNAGLPRPEYMNAFVASAYRAADKPTAGVGQLILALDTLDRELTHAISRLSHAATALLREYAVESDRYRAARVRSQREYAEALMLVAPEAGSGNPEEAYEAVRQAMLDQLRRHLIERLVGRGVKLIETDGTYCLRCAAHLATLIRSARGLQSAIAKKRYAPGVPAEYERVLAELAAAGVTGA